MATVQELVVKITGDASSFKSAIQETKSAGESVGSAFQNVGDKITAAGKAATAAFTVPIVGAATTAVTKFAEVDKTMQLVNATMGNTEDEAKLIEDAMKTAAANSTFAMSDAANATLNFARAGLTAEEAANALAPAMNLAAGEGGNLDTVSAGLVATINGFGDSFGKAGDYADVFAAACNNSALDVDSLSGAMSTAAPIFSAAGYAVNDAALYMGVMANAGIPASEAANSLKTGLARLIEPSKDGAEWMERLGINITNADGTMKDSVTVQKELHDAFGTLSESEQIAAASAIFGKNQMSKWLALINTAPEEVADLDESLEHCAGTTDEMAEAMMSGFGGSIEKLKSSIDVLMTSLGQLLAQYLQPIIDKAQEWVDKFNAMSDAEKDQAIKIAGIVAAIGPLLIAGGKVFSGIGKIISIGAKIAPLFEGAGAAGTAAGSAGAAGFGAIASAAAVVIAVIAAVAAAVYSIVESFGGVEGAVQRVKEMFTNIMDNIKHKIEEVGIGEKIEKLKEKFGELTEKLGNMRDFWEVIFTVIEKVASIIGMTLVTAFGVLIDVIGDIIDFIGGLIDILGGLGTLIVGVFTGDMDKVKEGASRMWEGVKEVFTGAISAIGDILKGLWDLVTGIFKDIKYALIGDPIVIDMWEGIKTVFSNAIEAVVNFVSGLFDSVVGFFTDLKDKVVNAVSELWSGVTEKFNDLKEKVVEKVSDLKEKAVEKFTDLKEKATEKFTELKDKVVEKATDLKEKTTEKITDLKDKAVDKFNDIKDKVTDKFNSTKEKVVEYATNMADKAKEKFGDIADKAKEKFDDVKDKVKDKMSDAYDSLKDKCSDMYDTVKDKFSDIYDNVKDKCSNVYDTIKDKFSEAKDTAKEKFEDMKDAIKDKMDEIKDWVRDKMDTIKGVFEKVDLTSIGSNIIGGLWNGLKDKMSQVMDWIREKAQAIKEKFADLMQIGSPSKVFRQYGRWIDEGLVLGLGDGSSAIDKEINSLANGVNVGFTSSLETDHGTIGATTVNLNGDYMFQDKASMDYFLNRMQLALNRAS